MIAMTQADIPMLAPTEMSKFPEIMRRVAPAATRPRTDTCSRMFSMLFKPKNRGLTRPVTTARAASTMRRKTHWFLKIATALCISDSDEELDEHLFRDALPVQHVREPPSAHDADAVAHGYQLWHVGGYHDDALAFLRKLDDETEDLGARAHIDTFCRFVEDVESGVAQQPSADDRFLLVAAGELGYGLRLLVGDRDPQPLHHFPHLPAFRGKIQHGRLIALVMHDGDVLRDIAGGEHGQLLPVLRDETDAVAHCAGGGVDMDGPTVDEDLTPVPP